MKKNNIDIDLQFREKYQARQDIKINNNDLQNLYQAYEMGIDSLCDLIYDFIENHDFEKALKVIDDIYDSTGDNSEKHYFFKGDKDRLTEIARLREIERQGLGW